MKTNILIAAIFMLLVSATAVYAGTGGPAPVPAPPGYNLTTNATALCRGQTNYIPITITNHGTGDIGSMQDTTLGLVTTRGMLASTLDIGTVPANTVKTYKFPVFVDANASLYIPTGITINYFYYEVYTDSEVQNMSFTTRACVEPITATISPKIITAGAIENLTLNITNAGPYTLNALSVSLNVPASDAALLGNQPIEINSIRPHSSMILSQQVYVSKNASQSFPANLTIDYYNGTALSQAWNDTQLLTTGIINITSSSLTLSPTVPSPGSIFSISLVLTNTGSSGASAVTAAIVPTNGISAYGGNSVFIGSVGADSQVPVTLSATTDPSMHNGVYQIPIQINYLNGLRQNVSQSITVPVQILASNAINVTAIRSRASGGSGLLVLVLIIIIIVLLVLYYRERKKISRHMK